MLTDLECLPDISGELWEFGTKVVNSGLIEEWVVMIIDSVD